ncbi:MAG TPA: retropepsin-like aspartic protease [Candidatus Lokiarchaeia archaeon]|nr:retropepsin-like aspartic protease [Candidatus Lokiarchaeia archaeon]
MGKIEKTIEITGDKDSTTVTALFDSGSAKTFIRKDIAETVCNILMHETPIEIQLADGESTINEIGVCTLKMVIEDHELFDTVRVINVGKKSAEMYIGQPTLQRFNIRLKFGKMPDEDELDLSHFTPELNELY